MNAFEYIRKYCQAGYAAVAVETWEEDRLVRDTLAMWERGVIYRMGAGTALRDVRRGGAVRRAERDEDVIVPAGKAHYAGAMDRAIAAGEGILFLSDIQHFIQEPAIARALLDRMAMFKLRRVTVVMMAPSWRLPDDLKHSVPVQSIPLPTEEELNVSLQAALDAPSTKQRVNDEQRRQLLIAAKGLTLEEAEDAYASAVCFPNMPIEVVEQEKMKLVRSQCTTHEKPLPLEMFGGYGGLKQYIEEEVLPVKDDPQLRVRGILLLGPPGCGKSTACRMIASKVGWPLIRLDIPAAKGSLVGQSESNLRQAFARIRAVGNCVVWADEMEKAVGGYVASAASDAGVTLGMVGTLLTELQEQKDALYVVTVNDFSKLPPELARAGRIDERFFMDHPVTSERTAIAEIHLARLGLDAELASVIAEMTDKWTGAEIEQLIKSAARRTMRGVTREALAEAKAKIVPAHRYSDVEELRKWARERVRWANDAEVESPVQTHPFRRILEERQRERGNN